MGLSLALGSHCGCFLVFIDSFFQFASCSPISGVTFASSAFRSVTLHPFVPLPSVTPLVLNLQDLSSHHPKPSSSSADSPCTSSSSSPIYLHIITFEQVIHIFYPRATFEEKSLQRIRGYEDGNVSKLKPSTFSEIQGQYAPQLRG